MCVCMCVRVCYNQALQGQSRFVVVNQARLAYRLDEAVLHGKLDTGVGVRFAPVYGDIPELPLVMCSQPLVCITVQCGIRVSLIRTISMQVYP